MRGPSGSRLSSTINEVLIRPALSDFASTHRHLVRDVVTTPLHDYDDDHMDVGIRDLKAHLSEHLERVANGEVITVTSRGRRVAQIVPVPGRDDLERGIAEGWITRQVDRPPQPVLRQRPLQGTPSTTELISRDRGA